MLPTLPSSSPRRRSRRLALVAATVLAPLLAGVAPAAAAPADLDPAFGSGGKVTTAFGPWAFGYAVAPAPDGRIVVAGAVYNDKSGYDDFAVVRYSPDGTLDPTFDGDGKATVFMAGGNGASAVAVQPDGKIVVVGTVRSATTGTDFAVVRFNPDGTLDPTFDGDGKVVTDVQPYFTAGNDSPYAVAVAGDGKIVVAGESQASGGGATMDFAAVRYNPDGTLDPTFWAGGKMARDGGGGSADIARAVLLQPDGRIVLVGSSLAPGGSRSFAVLRCNSDGTPDGSFDGDGFATTAIGTLRDEAFAGALQPDGKIVAAGTTNTPGSSQFGVVRYNPDGTLDPTFDGDGKATTSSQSGSGPASEARGLALAPGGKIVVVGLTVGGFYVVRYNPDGSLDPDFDGDGRATTPLGEGESASGVAVQPDGRIVVAGTTNTPTDTGYEIAVVRYLGGDTPVTSPPVAARSGYWMVGSDGGVYPFGDARGYGKAPAAVDLEPTPSGNGYWTVDGAGVVSAFGDARHLGNADRSKLTAGESVTSLSATPTGNGYWIFTTKGRVLPMGDATAYGDMSAVKLNGPVLDSIPTPSGHGYYMVSSDGGIFSFGDAKYYGSMGGKKLNAAVQSLVPDSDGAGYWLVASDGGIFAFDTPFRGSMGNQKLNRPVTGMVRFGNGYLMVGEDGGIFNFSDRPFYGSLGAHPPKNPITSVAVLEK